MANEKEPHEIPENLMKSMMIGYGKSMGNPLEMLKAGEFLAKKFVNGCKKIKQYVTSGRDKSEQFNQDLERVGNGEEIEPK